MLHIKRHANGIPPSMFVVCKCGEREHVKHVFGFDPPDYAMPIGWIDRPRSPSSQVYDHVCPACADADRHSQ